MKSIGPAVRAILPAASRGPGPFWRPLGMETEAIRALIRVKLRDGRLPSDGMPIALGRPGSGHKCDGCDEVLAITVLMMMRGELVPVSAVGYSSSAQCAVGPAAR